MSLLTKEASLSSIFSYKPIRTIEAQLLEDRKLYEREAGLSCRKMVDQTCYVGIEIEIEKVPIHKHIAGWEPVPDGSLRNDGIEYVSVPVRGQNIHYLLHKLLTESKKEGAEFTERTSNHIHLNVRRMTVEQLVTLLITYVVVEQSMYRYIKHMGFDRHRNIFCVPLSESQHYLGLPYLIYLLKQNDISGVVDVCAHMWKKYSGLNLLPIMTQGTIEFRQLPGTFEIDFILDWINIIQSLRLFALSHTLEEVKGMIFDLNTNSNYQIFLQEVFGRYARQMNPPLGEGFQELEEGITNVKQAFMLKENFGITSETFEKSSVKEYLDKVYGSLSFNNDDVYNTEIKKYKIAMDMYAKVNSLDAKRMIASYQQHIEVMEKSKVENRKPPKASKAMLSLYSGRGR